MPLHISLGRTQLQAYFWNEETIEADAVSPAILTSGYRDKILTFITDTGGDLTIQTDPTGDGNWGTYDTVTFVANTRQDYNFPSGMQHTRIRISFDTAAVVTGSLSMF